MTRIDQLNNQIEIDHQEKRSAGRPPKAESLRKTFSIKVDYSLYPLLQGADKDLLRDALRHCVAATDETFVAVKRELGGGV